MRLIGFKIMCFFLIVVYYDLLMICLKYGTIEGQLKKYDDKLNKVNSVVSFLQYYNILFLNVEKH